MTTLEGPIVLDLSSGWTVVVDRYTPLTATAFGLDPLDPASVGALVQELHDGGDPVQSVVSDVQFATLRFRHADDTRPFEWRIATRRTWRNWFRRTSVAPSLSEV